MDFIMPDKLLILGYSKLSSVIISISCSEIHSLMFVPSSKGNVFQAAWRAGIDNPRALTLPQCWAGVKACKKLLKEQEEQAGPLQREHLQNRYELASDLKDTTKCAKIMDIIKREEQRDQWRQIKQATGDPQTGATNLVQ
jgi:hypothetical protein